MGTVRTGWMAQYGTRDRAAPALRHLHVDVADRGANANERYRYRPFAARPRCVDSLSSFVPTSSVSSSAFSERTGYLARLPFFNLYDDIQITQLGTFTDEFGPGADEERRRSDGQEDLRDSVMMAVSGRCRTSLSISRVVSSCYSPGILTPQPAQLFPSPPSSGRPCGCLHPARPGGPSSRSTAPLARTPAIANRASAPHAPGRPSAAGTPANTAVGSSASCPPPQV